MKLAITKWEISLHGVPIARANYRLPLAPGKSIVELLSVAKDMEGLRIELTIVDEEGFQASEPPER